jgi:ribosomal protein L37AE/L43A
MSAPVRHAPPFYCPYCGDEDLRPADDSAGSWECGACRRAFTLTFRGIVAGESAAEREQL